MDVGYEVDHLVVVEVELVECVAHAHYLIELVIVFLVLAPGLGEQVLYSLDRKSVV